MNKRGPFFVDARNAEAALADLLRNLPEVGNRRYIRHVYSVKKKFHNREGIACVWVTEKQASTLTHALERAHPKPKLKLVKT